MLIKATKVAEIISCPKSRVYDIARSPEKYGLPHGIVFHFEKSVRFHEEKLRRFLNGEVAGPKNSDVDEICERYAIERERL